MTIEEIDSQRDKANRLIRLLNEAADKIEEFEEICRTHGLDGEDMKRSVFEQLSPESQEDIRNFRKKISELIVLLEDQK